MPNCPICGKEVQSTTAYCPSRGTDLRQVSAGPTMPTGSYPPAYSYPQQGAMIPAGGQSHSHRKYILAIVAVGHNCSSNGWIDRLLTPDTARLHYSNGNSYSEWPI